MAQADHKQRTTLDLYTRQNDPYSCWVRIVLAEKNIQANIINIGHTQPLPQEFLRINPYGVLPTLVDRDLILYKAHIISEYLDERFPHPPLLPVEPLVRAKIRQIIYRIEKDWYSLLHQMEREGNSPKVQQLLQNSLAGLAPLFSEKPYFLSDGFGLVDCCITPLLWRLHQLDIKITNRTIHKYQQTLFERSAVQTSVIEID